MVVSIVIPRVKIVITTIMIVITTVSVVVPTLLPVIPTKKIVITIVITTIYDDSIDGCNNSKNTYTDSNKVMRAVWIVITTVTKL